MDSILTELLAEGVDVKEALEQIDGDEEIYLFVLRRFTNDDSIIKIEKELNTNEVEKVFDIAHTLKGMYASLYFIKEFEICSEIVEMLRGCNTISEEVFLKFKELKMLHNRKIGIIERQD